MTKRAPISKKTRFEVFKRDGFICVYCGQHPPQIILEVDHVIPVAKGGLSEEDNLVTACFSCNRGKSAKKLDSIPKSLKLKAEKAKEIDDQIVGYQNILREIEMRIENEAFQILDYLGLVKDDGYANKGYITTTKNQIKIMGYHEVMAAAEIAFSNVEKRDIFRYFCGVCKHKKIESGY